MYGEKIKMIRELRNYSQEHMADSLGIKQNMYSRIENNQTKLTAEVLQKISNILGVSPLDIMNHQPAIINLQPNQGTQHAIGYIETYITQHKELMDKLVSSKDEEIDHLKNLLKEVIGKIKN